jgi:glyoxylase-like metal-dependent hydrolase (beta-lactamase superfamily II)
MRSSALPSELAPGLWRWTARHGEWHPPGFEQVAAFAVQDEAGTVLVDPIVPEHDGEGVLEALDGIVGGTLRIVVTIPYHVRSSELLWQRYRRSHGALVHGHPNAATRLHDRSGFRPAAPGDVLAGGVRFHRIGSPRRAEMPVELPSQRALAFGDAVLEVAGELRVWEEPPRDERRRAWYAGRFLPTLEPLAELDLERVLVTHGDPVLADGSAALRRAFARPPWVRRGYDGG